MLMGRWDYEMTSSNENISYQEREYQAVLTYLIDAMFSLSFPVHICTGSIMRLILAQRTLTLCFVSQGMFPVRSKTYGDLAWLPFPYYIQDCHDVFHMYIYTLTGNIFGIGILKIPWCMYRCYHDVIRVLGKKEKAVWKAFAKQLPPIRYQPMINLPKVTNIATSLQCLKSPASRLLTQLFIQGTEKKKTSKLCITDLCEGNSPVTGHQNLIICMIQTK